MELVDGSGMFHIFLKKNWKIFWKYWKYLYRCE